MMKLPAMVDAAISDTPRSLIGFSPAFDSLHRKEMTFAKRAVTIFFHCNCIDLIFDFGMNYGHYG